MTEIVHEMSQRRYSLAIDGVEAHLDYERRPDGGLHITHTIVPDVLGGRGLGKQLVRRAVEDAAAKGVPVTSSCWFATDLLARNPAWKTIGSTGS